MVSKAFSEHWLAVFWISLSTWILKSNFKSKIIPKCFWWGYFFRSLLMKVGGGWEWTFDFQENVTSLACLLGSGLKYIFHWKAHSLIFSKSRFSFFVDSFTSSTFEKREVSSAKILHIDIIPSGRSFMWIKNKRGPNTDPCGTFIPSTQKSDHLKQPFVYDFQYKFPVEKVTHHQCHILSRYQEIHLSHQQDCYQKQFVFHVINSSCPIHESPGRKPDWEGVKSLLSLK